MQIRVSDFAGKPFQGTTVLSVYDKSVEYISGGSNVPEIKAFFWKWRRNHQPQTESNLSLSFWNLLKQGEVGMSFLGAFGHIESDQSRPQLLAGFGGGKGEGLRGRSLKAMNAAPGAPMAATTEFASSDRQVDALQKRDGADKAASAGEPPAELAQPSVRKNFADTAYWAGSLTTDKDGLAEVEFTMPESLTGWKVKSWSLGHGTKVGQGEAKIVTVKNLLVRMQAPRFFVETDEVVLSANVHNYLKTDKEVTVALEFDGQTLSSATSPLQKITIKAGGEERVDWRVKVNQEGEAVVRMKALSDEESDAMEMRFPVYVHGMLKTESFAGALRPNQKSGQFEITVPKERRINESRLEIRYSPSLAGAMVDALPYLVNSPHDSTDVTLARFLPTVITQNILLRLKLDLKAIQEQRTNLNAQEIGDDRDRAKQWKRYDENPVFDVDEVRSLVRQGVAALSNMQLSDGGWGWFSGYGEYSSPHTTALVVHGFQLAKANDVALLPNVLEQGVEWLKHYQAEQVRRLKNAPAQTQPWKGQADNLDALVYMVLVDADVADPEMLEFLYRDRTKLGVYGMGLYGLALHKQGQAEKLAMILQNIDQFLVQDDENQTAYLKLPAEGYWWYWYGSEIEANAYYLKLLAKTDAKQEKASRLVKYLLNNRKHATYWNSTRDTAICIEALAEYLVASGED
ncbi:hypothetical protein BH10PLA2_BH10PLA2_38530 [soil metagenome]